MASQVGSSESITEEPATSLLVRRFTDDLEGTTTLENHLKNAQFERDANRSIMDSKHIARLLEEADNGGP
jgi:hypothetical protein